MYCNYCGSEIPAGSKYCEYCGAIMTQQSNAAKSSGAENYHPLQNSQRNENVSQDQTQRASRTQPTRVEKETSKKKMDVTIVALIIALAVLAVAAIGLAVSLLLNNQDGSQPNDLISTSNAVETVTSEVADITQPEIQTQPTTLPTTVSTIVAPDFSSDYMDVTFSYDYVDFRVPISGYILQGSEYRDITESELYGMTEHQCALARNEIYARHGRQFNSPRVADYFEHMPWYYGYIPASEFDKNVSAYLNWTEQNNIAIIAAYERKMGWG